MVQAMLETPKAPGPASDQSQAPLHSAASQSSEPLPLPSYSGTSKPQMETMFVNYGNTTQLAKNEESGHEHAAACGENGTESLPNGFMLCGAGINFENNFADFESLNKINTPVLDFSQLQSDPIADFHQLSPGVCNPFKITPALENPPLVDLDVLDNMAAADVTMPSALSHSILDHPNPSIEITHPFEIIPVPGEVQPPVSIIGKFLKREMQLHSADLLEAKGYNSDSSDAYMNSDYTDTISSVTSETFLLSSSKYSKGEDGPCTLDTIHATSSSSEATPVHDFYRNRAFTDSSDLLDQYDENPDIAESDALASSLFESDVKNRYSSELQWPVISSSKSIGARDEIADHGKDVLVRDPIPLEPETIVATFVEPMQDRVLEEFVTVPVEEHIGPVYHSLTEPIPEEGNWMDSTESLRMYKRMKQGRTDTTFGLPERNSFINLTSASVNSIGRALQRAMPHVRADIEFGSMMSLRDTLKQPESLGHDTPLTPGERETLYVGPDKKAEPVVASGRHTLNLILMSLVVTLLLISINATRNLQSSINQEGGVGLTSLAVYFAFYTLGSLLSPVLVQRLGVRHSITIGLAIQLLYIGANLYPRMWLMVPSSAFSGAMMAVIWNAMSTYIVLLARGEANVKGQTVERTSDRYFGIFCLIYQCNLVIGNLIASLILTFGDRPGTARSIAIPLPSNHSGQITIMPIPILSNSLEVGSTLIIPNVLMIETTSFTTEFLADISAGKDAAATTYMYNPCGSQFCHQDTLNGTESMVADTTKYLLFGIYLALVVVAIGISAFFMESLSSRLFSPVAAPWQTVKRQVVSLVKFSRNAKFILLLPLLFFSFMQFGFVCSEVTMAFVTCPVGVWLVGYTMICYGVTCSLSSYLTQALTPRTGRMFFIGLAAVLNLAMLLFMLLWQPKASSTIPLFFITSLWGFADGIWNVNANNGPDYQQKINAFNLSGRGRPANIQQPLTNRLFMQLNTTCIKCSKTWEDVGIIFFIGSLAQKCCIGFFVLM